MKNKEEKNKHATYKAKCPGDIYLLGSAVANIDLRHPWNKAIALGRPWVWLAIDMFSSFITGVHKSFSPPKANDTIALLCDAAADKVIFCEKFGITINKTDWPASGLPNGVASNRGEMLDLSLLASKGVKIMHGIYSPFNTGALLQAIIDKTVKAMSAKCGSSMMSGKGTAADDKHITSAMFDECLIAAIIDYNKSIQPKLRRTPEMIASGIEPSPLAVWNWGIQHHSGLLRHVSPEQILSLRLQPGMATVTRRGICLRGITYLSVLALSERWFERAGNSGNRSIEIRYDPCSVDRIFAIGEKYSCIEEMHLVGESESYRGLTWAEYEVIQAERRRLFRAHEAEQLLLGAPSTQTTVMSKLSDCGNVLPVANAASHSKQKTGVHDANFVDAIQRHLLVQNISIKDAYFKLLEDHYCVFAIDGKGKTIKTLKSPFPTYRQFQYFLQNRLGCNS